VAESALGNPILNSPYDAPARHFALGPTGPTGEVLPGRRPSESFIPIPASKKGKKGKGTDDAEQIGLDFDTTGERREQNSLINDIRARVELWRGRNYTGVTPMSRKLLQHWAGTVGTREDRMLFCQREAAETAIYLAEVAGRKGEPDFRTRLDEQNLGHNDGMPRVALKMATGSGKTVVMAMLIAWQTINKVASPRDPRFAKRFLVVTPGITIRDRLRVLQPSADDNYYAERDLVPADLWGHLLEAQVVITNYHTFLLRDAPEIKGVASTTRKLLNAGKKTDPFKETEDDMVSRVLREFGGGVGAKTGEIVVINDEAHHCYQDKLIDAVDATEKADREDKARNEDARVWFRGIRAIARKVGVKSVYDLSATPFYLKGSGYYEGFIFPWVVSDFSLMDSIESGIVKVPRVPVDDDAAGDILSYLHLWDLVGEHLPKKLPKGTDLSKHPLPEVLEGALESLHRSYEGRFNQWEELLRDHGEPPPVMIVVCPNTTVSKIVYDWIAGADFERPDGEVVARDGRLPLLSNVVDGEWLKRPPTILIDSAALESGETLAADFKKVAAQEIDVFKAEYRRRNPGADVDKLTDEDLLREVMNTVGKKGKLGEQIRCVVSVSMLTEGWDANTVTHILGIRAFRSQLLCEQVVGRGLRRRSYAPNEHGMFEPEYADVYGVPFAFIPSDQAIPTPKDPRPATLVDVVSGREHMEIRFPKLSGYRIELTESVVFEDFGPDAAFHVKRNEVATWVRNEGIAGEGEEIDLDRYRNARRREVAFRIASLLVFKFSNDGNVPVKDTSKGEGGDLTPERSPERPWLFTRLVQIADHWLRDHVSYDSDAFVGLLLPAQASHRAAEHLFSSIVKLENSQNELLLPLFQTFDPVGTTADVHFLTRKAVIEATKSQVSHVVLDGIKGNTWEEGVAGILEQHQQVHSFVKNDSLGFRIPYVHEGRTHEYIPDFLVRLTPAPDGIERTLIIEVSGSRKSPGLRAAKARTAREHWCPAVNNHGGWGLWGYIELADPPSFGPLINAGIAELYEPMSSSGTPIAGVLV
jgi:type III restriction enzyme